MSDISIASSESDFSAPTISIPGQKITWAGEGLQSDRFLFGTDNGLILECGINGSLENMHSVRLGQDEESINAVAFCVDENALHLAATTRTDIILNSFFVSPPRRAVWHAGFGAHGIKRTHTHWFIAPAGPSGVVAVKSDSGEVVDDRNFPPIEHAQYFYDYATLGIDQESGLEVSVFACRRDGLAFFYVEPDVVLKPIRFSKVGTRIIDFISVSSIGNSVDPLAWMGLGKGKTLHFMRNPLRIEAIDTLELSFVPGIPYKVLRYGPHAFLLTSKGVCIVLDVVRQYHHGELKSGKRPVRFIGMEAIDINIAFNKWLLVVLPNGIIRMDLAAVLPGVDIPDAIKARMTMDFEALRETEEERVQIEQPVWSETELESKLLVGVG
jgi:hypothetical protein